MYCVELYVDFMRDERAFPPVTITNCRDEIGHFLTTVCRAAKAFDAVTLHDVDNYLAYQGNHGWPGRRYTLLRARVAISCGPLEGNETVCTFHFSVYSTRS